MILAYLLCVVLTRWYLREPAEVRIFHVGETNLNPAVDEWNAREFVETESENFYE